MTPWGPRYDSEKRGETVTDDHAEIALLKYLQFWLSRWPKCMRDRTQWTFIGADSYGRINGLPDSCIKNYFDSMKSHLGRHLPSAKFMMWSEFDREAAAYREEAQKVYLPRLHPFVFQRATLIAQKKRGSAAEYLVERLAEALLLERKFKPIKISCASKKNDSEVDLRLPRLYFVPAQLQAPWNGNRFS